MKAIIETGSKQYLITVGSVIKTERLNGNVGDLTTFDKLLMINDKFQDTGKVVAEILDHRKTEKQIIFKKKRRHNYRRKRGHRQNITILKIKEILE